MYKKLISLLKEEKGYNTVEALLWIAAVAVLSVAVTSELEKKLTGDGGAVETVDDTIKTLLTNVSNEAVK